MSDPETDLTNAELVILSLIHEQPMHGYQIEGAIDGRNMRVWTDLATSSIYYILQRLENKGHIRALSQEAGERGKPRKVYEITEGGKRAWKDATLRALSQPTTTYTNFLIGVHNLWAIDRGEAAQAVTTYRDWLKADLQRQRDALKALEISFFPVDVLFEYGFVLGDAELDFLDKLIRRLESMDD